MSGIFIYVSAFCFYLFKVFCALCKSLRLVIEGMEYELKSSKACCYVCLMDTGEPGVETDDDE